MIWQISCHFLNINAFLMDVHWYAWSTFDCHFSYFQWLLNAILILLSIPEPSWCLHVMTGDTNKENCNYRYFLQENDKLNISIFMNINEYLFEICRIMQEDFSFISLKWDLNLSNVMRNKKIVAWIKLYNGIEKYPWIWQEVGILLC